MIETQAPLHPPQQVAESEAKAEPSLPHRRGRFVVIGVLPFLATAVICPALTVWVLRMVQGPERAAVQQALNEREQAQKDERSAESQRNQAVAARQSATEQRDQARATEKSTRRSEQDIKAVLTFLQDNVLTPNHQKSGGDAGKVTLRHAVDAAEPKVAEAFADRPLVEASVRLVLGSIYLDLDEPERAVQQLKRALDLREGELGPDGPAAGECRNKLAVAYRSLGRPDDASHLFNQNRLSPSHVAALSVEGSALLAEKKWFEAELKLRESLSIRRKIQPDDWTTFDAMTMLGAALTEQKKYAKAESLLLSGYQGMKQRESKIMSSDRKPHLAKALERLVRLYESWGKEDEAAKWREELRTLDSPKKL